MHDAAEALVRFWEVDSETICTGNGVVRFLPGVRVRELQQCTICMRVYCRLPSSSSLYLSQPFRAVLHDSPMTAVGSLHVRGIIGKRRHRRGRPRRLSCAQCICCCPRLLVTFSLILSTPCRASQTRSALSTRPSRTNMLQTRMTIARATPLPPTRHPLDPSPLAPARHSPPGRTTSSPPQSSSRVSRTESFSADTTLCSTL